MRRQTSLRSRCLRAGFVVGLLAAPNALAEGDGAVTEKVQHGEVNWTEKTVMATGSGAPNLKLPNVAAVRLDAERAAQLAAYRNILEAVKGVRVTANVLGGEQIGKEQVRTQVEGIIRGCKTVDTRYFSDYGVDVVVKCPIDGSLALVLAPPKVHRALETQGDAKYTGLVVDATGLTKLKPAIAPKLITNDGEEIYGQEMVKPAFLRKHGSLAYYKGLEIAQKSERVGEKPLVIKAAALAPGDSDLKIGAEEAAKLKGINLAFLTEGRVAIATDAGAAAPAAGAEKK